MDDYSALKSELINALIARVKDYHTQLPMDMSKNILISIHKNIIYDRTNTIFPDAFVAKIAPKDVFDNICCILKLDPENKKVFCLLSQHLTNDILQKYKHVIIKESMLNFNKINIKADIDALIISLNILDTYKNNPITTIMILRSFNVKHKPHAYQILFYEPILKMYKYLIKHYPELINNNTEYHMKNQFEYAIQYCKTYNNTRVLYYILRLAIYAELKLDNKIYKLIYTKNSLKIANKILKNMYRYGRQHRFNKYFDENIKGVFAKTTNYTNYNIMVKMINKLIELKTNN